MKLNELKLDNERRQEYLLWMYYIISASVWGFVFIYWIHLNTKYFEILLDILTALLFGGFLIFVTIIRLKQYLKEHYFRKFTEELALRHYYYLYSTGKIKKHGY
jgi:hypothetical protein